MSSATNPWPTSPATIRAASQIGARPVRSTALPIALARLGHLAVNLALAGAVLYFLAALYCAA